MDKKQLLGSNLPVVTEYDPKYDKADLKTVEKMAEQNDPAALYELAARYFRGIDGAEKDYEKAILFSRKVLKFQRNAGAMYHIGFIYCEGFFGDEKIPECIGYYEAAVELGHEGAAIQLGIMYEYGFCVKTDYDKALRLFRFALKKGRKDAWFNIGEVYRRQSMWAKAADAYKRSIDAGNMQAAYPLGCLYENGRGVEKNYKTAFELFKKAYDDGDIMAPFALGLYYYYGVGTEKNAVKSFRYLKEALNNDDRRAYLYLAALYLHGIPGNLAPDKQTAQKYLDQTPKDYEPGMQHYLKGVIGLSQHRYDEAINDLSAAKKAGSSEAARVLELFKGPDCESIERAFPGIFRAAVSGNVKARYNLAMVYMNGASKTDSDVTNFEKMKYWGKTCRKAKTDEGSYYFALFLSRWCRFRRKARAYEKGFDEDLKLANQILLGLENAGKYTEEAHAQYYKNIWELGWFTIYSSPDIKNEKSLSRAFDYFQEVWNNYPCSDALHGMAVVALFSNWTTYFAQWTSDALGHNKWLDEEMHANALCNMGSVFLSAKENGKDCFELAYEQFTKAAELGNKNAEEKLKHFHRNVFGKIRYEES